MGLISRLHCDDEDLLVFIDSQRIIHTLNLVTIGMIRHCNLGFNLRIWNLLTSFLYAFNIWNRARDGINSAEM